MAETPSNPPPQRSRDEGGSMEEAYRALETPDIHDASTQIEKGRKAYSANTAGRTEPAPTRAEVNGWYVYAFCSYFVQAFLLPVIFPLIVTEIAWPDDGALPPPPPFTSTGIACSRQQMMLYQRIVHRSISIPIGSTKLSPLHWTAISWATGIFLATPFLPHIAHHLDHTNHQPLILGSATMAGAFFCLLTGFFRTTYIFPLYIAGIAASATVAAAAHSHHLILITRSLPGKTHHRAAISSWLALSSAAAGSVGAAVIAAFTYNMLRRSDRLTSLWVVSIFSGLKWAIGVTNAITHRPGSIIRPSPSALAHISTVASHPAAAVGLVSSFLSNFSTTCIFASANLFILSGLCVRPVFVLSLWIAYFTFAAASRPVLHPLMMVLRANAARMQVLGFLMSAAASGMGFYYKDDRWVGLHILLVGMLQSSGVGAASAFGRVMVVGAAPAGKEGAFAAWVEWARAAGACAGFAVAAGFPGDVGTTFGVSFVAVVVGIVVLVFGSGRGAGGEGNVEEEKSAELGSPVRGLDRVGEGSVQV